MMTLIAGALLVVAVLAATIDENASFYLQAHSLVLVFGGTFSVLLLANPGGVLVSLGKAIVSLFGKEDSVQNHQTALSQLMKDRSKPVTASHPLITYASELWTQGVDPELFIVLLSQRRAEISAREVNAVQVLKNLGKYPPALGMIGTVLGMVRLFSTLDKNKDAIGSNLSLAMTATFLGLIAANFLITPLADRLQMRQRMQERVAENLCEVLLLLNRNEASSLIQEELNERIA